LTVVILCETINCNTGIASTYTDHVALRSYKGLHLCSEGVALAINTFSLGLEEQCAWVLGASGEIGSAIASELARHGVKVWLSGRKQSTLEITRDRILKAGGQARVVVLDESDPNHIENAAAQVIADAGRLHLLVNSTASSTFGSFLELTDADWQAAFLGKLMVYVRSMRAVLPHMTQAAGGVILNISGRAGRMPSPAHLPGGSMNAAVNLLTKGISEQYRHQGIRANTVAPGPIVSERFESLAAQQQVGVGSTAPVIEAPKGTPQDVANAVTWLASERASHLHGIVLPLDGGAIPVV
jgi:NAD(P)-dependent dehydrogenase (short-subunit alcohol dehydrogenase family)